VVKFVDSGIKKKYTMETDDWAGEGDWTADNKAL